MRMKLSVKKCVVNEKKIKIKVFYILMLKCFTRSRLLFVRSRWLIPLILCVGCLSNTFNEAHSNSIDETGYRALKNGDYKTALRYISYLATNGDPRAQYNMGIFYRDGIEVKSNDTQALRWFLKAAKGGHMLGEYASGMAFYLGHGTTPDLQMALNYFVRAALKGHAKAPLNIGQILYSGKEGKTDYVRIYLWWKIASERQAEGADEKLLGLTKMMSEDEMREARVLIKKCRSMTMKQCLPFMLPGKGLRPL